MAEGQDRQAWLHTSTLLAMTANVNRDAKKRRIPFVPAEFDHYATKADVAAQKEAAALAVKGGVPVTRENIDVLRTMLPGGGHGRRGEVN